MYILHIYVRRWESLKIQTLLSKNQYIYYVFTREGSGDFENTGQKQDSLNESWPKVQHSIVHTYADSAYLICYMIKSFRI